MLRECGGERAGEVHWTSRRFCRREKKRSAESSAFAVRRTHRCRLKLAHHADQTTDIINLPSRVVNPLLHRALLEGARHGPLILVHALGAETQCLRDCLWRESAEGVFRAGRAVRGRRGRRDGRWIRTDEAEDFFEQVVREDIVDEPVTRENDDVVPPDFDVEPLRVFRGRVFGVRAGLERVVEPVLLLLRSEDVFVPADDEAGTVAQVG